VRRGKYQHSFLEKDLGHFSKDSQRVNISKLNFQTSLSILMKKSGLQMCKKTKLMNIYLKFQHSNPLNLRSSSCSTEEEFFEP